MGLDPRWVMANSGGNKKAGMYKAGGAAVGGWTVPPARAVDEGFRQGGGVGRKKMRSSTAWASPSGEASVIN